MRKRSILLVLSDSFETRCQWWSAVWRQHFGCYLRVHYLAQGFVGAQHPLSCSTLDPWQRGKVWSVTERINTDDSSRPDWTPVPLLSPLDREDPKSCFFPRGGGRWGVDHTVQHLLSLTHLPYKGSVGQTWQEGIKQMALNHVIMNMTSCCPALWP